MSNIIQHAEEIIYDWILSLPDEEMKDVTSAGDVLDCINEEAEEEIKNELWNVIKNQISYSAILRNVRLYLAQMQESDSDESFSYT